jgi:hypothetical protein
VHRRPPELRRSLLAVIVAAACALPIDAAADSPPSGATARCRDGSIDP